MLVCSFIYCQSFYDIYTLNNLGVKDLESYYLEDVSGENLGKLYDSLINHNGIIEITKEPVTNNEKMLYEIYDTDNVNINKKVSITDDKQFKYYTLTRNDFIDSTGKFKTNLKYNEIKSISNSLSLSIKQLDNESISYSQVISNNLLNIVILLLLTQFVLFIYTLLRVKVNAVKKLMGFSSTRIIFESYTEFAKFLSLSAIITIVVHIIYFSIKDTLNSNYIIGLVLVILIISAVNLLLLLVTVVSVKFLDISSVIKNKLFSNTLNMLVLIAKVCFVVIISLSISMFSNQYNQYSKSLKSIDKYKSLANYYTSNGYNSDEYDKVFNNTKSIEKVSSSMKQLYVNYADKLLLTYVNVMDNISNNYYQVTGVSFNELLASYSDNYSVLNKHYLKNYTMLYDEFGNKIDYDLLPKGTVLVPKQYKGNNEVNDFCKETYNDMINYDCFYTNKKISNKQLNVNIIYIDDNQQLNTLSKYQLQGKKIKNSIIFLDSGEFAGTWYLEAISNSNISLSLQDRDKFSSILTKYNLQKLLNAGTLMTPISEDIRYYEFTTYQSLVFVILFSVTLLFIVYLSNYLEIMTNRKKLAIKRLMGFSEVKSLLAQYISDDTLLFIVIIMNFININYVSALICILLDVLFLNIFYRKIIVNNVEGNLKGV